MNDTDEKRLNDYENKIKKSLKGLMADFDALWGLYIVTNPEKEYFSNEIQVLDSAIGAVDAATSWLCNFRKLRSGVTP